MKFDSPLFDRIRVKPGEDRRLRAGRAVLRLEGLRQRGDASRAEGPAARERVLAVLPRARARVQPLLQLLRRHERRRRRASTRRTRSPATARPGRWAPATIPAAPSFGADGRARSVQRVPRVRRARRRPRRAREPPRAIRNAERKALHELGLDVGADKAEIKARFKVLVKRHHPDANGGDRAQRRQAARDHPGLQLPEVGRRLLKCAAQRSDSPGRHRISAAAASSSAMQSASGAV